jgi:hypothetical protein
MESLPVFEVLPLYPPLQRRLSNTCDPTSASRPLSTHLSEPKAALRTPQYASEHTRCTFRVTRLRVLRPHPHATPWLQCLLCRYRGESPPRLSAHATESPAGLASSRAWVKAVIAPQRDPGPVLSSVRTGGAWSLLIVPSLNISSRSFIKEMGHRRGVTKILFRSTTHALSTGVGSCVAAPSPHRLSAIRSGTLHPAAPTRVPSSLLPSCSA